MPMLSWGTDFLEVVWSSRGLFLNRAALQQMARVAANWKHVVDSAARLTRLFLPQLTLRQCSALLCALLWILCELKKSPCSLERVRHVLMSGLVYTFAGDSQMQGLVEFVFAATLRAHEPSLRVRYMPEPNERFLEGELLLERFAFRVAAATFGWSKQDLRKAGVAKPSKANPRKRRLLQHLHRKKLRQGQTTFRASCLQRGLSSTSCSGSFPQCVLVMHPVDSSAMMRDMQQIIPRTTCLAASNLRVAEGVPIVRGVPQSLTATIRRGQVLARTRRGGQQSLHRADARLISHSAHVDRS